jgi:hypothetical protein
MAKKKPVAKKKPAAAKKVSPNTRKQPSSNKKKTPPVPAKKQNVPAKIQTTLANVADNGIHGQAIPLLPPNTMEDYIEGTRSNMMDFEDIAKSSLTDSQRKRKVGAGTRNYGFIDNVSDLAEANSQYVQFFNITNLKNCIRNVEACRDLAAILMGFWRAVTNTQLIYSDDAYSMALLFYNNVKEMARRGDPMAKELASELKTYFKKTKSSDKEPTEKEEMRDARALIKGKKEGKMIIENIKPHMTGGVHKVVDDIHSGHTGIKETGEAEVKE